MRTASRPARRSTGRFPDRAECRARTVPILRKVGVRSICRALSIAIYSSWPPPIVPKMRFGAHQHPCALFARRRPLGRRHLRPAPHADARRESLTGCWRAVAHGLFYHDFQAFACLHPLDRHQHALRRRRRVELRADLVIGDARHGIRQCVQHRNAERQRRFAHRLGAVDRRLIGLRPVDQRDVEDLRPVGCQRDLVGRRRMRAQPALGVPPQFLGGQPAHAPG